jgi:hypothetical protein
MDTVCSIFSDKLELRILPTESSCVLLKVLIVHSDYTFKKVQKTDVLAEM